MENSRHKHAVKIEKNENFWECGYVNSDGVVEALKPNFDTLYRARKYAAGIRMDVYHGTNDYIQSCPARPKKFPKEYPKLPTRPDGSSALELILSNSEGHHIDGRPKMLVRIQIHGTWLDEAIADDRESILKEVIHDLSEFSEQKLSDQIHETRLFFHQKQQVMRERNQKYLSEKVQEAIDNCRFSWTYIYAPFVAICAFYLGRAYQHIF